MCPEWSNMSPWNDSKKYERDSSDTFMMNCPSMPLSPPVWKIWWLQPKSKIKRRMATLMIVYHAEWELSLLSRLSAFMRETLTKYMGSMAWSVRPGGIIEFSDSGRLLHNWFRNLLMPWHNWNQTFLVSLALESDFLDGLGMIEFGHVQDIFA